MLSILFLWNNSKSFILLFQTGKTVGKVVVRVRSQEGIGISHRYTDEALRKVRGLPQALKTKNFIWIPP